MRVPSPQRPEARALDSKGSGGPREQVALVAAMGGSTVVPSSSGPLPEAPGRQPGLAPGGGADGRSFLGKGGVRGHQGCGGGWGLPWDRDACQLLGGRLEAAGCSPWGGLGGERLQGGRHICERLVCGRQAWEALGQAGPGGARSAALVPLRPAAQAGGPCAGRRGPVHSWEPGLGWSGPWAVLGLRSKGHWMGWMVGEEGAGSQPGPVGGTVPKATALFLCQPACPPGRRGLELCRVVCDPCHPAATLPGRSTQWAPHPGNAAPGDRSLEVGMGVCSRAQSWGAAVWLRARRGTRQCPSPGPGRYGGRHSSGHPGRAGAGRGGRPCGWAGLGWLLRGAFPGGHALWVDFQHTAPPGTTRKQPTAGAYTAPLLGQRPWTPRGQAGNRPGGAPASVTLVLLEHQ